MWMANIILKFPALFWMRGGANCFAIDRVWFWAIIALRTRECEKTGPER